MATLEFNQSNHVTNRQCNFDQPILMEGIPTGFKLKTSKLVKTVRKTKAISGPNLIKKMFH